MAAELLAVSPASVRLNFSPEDIHEADTTNNIPMQIQGHTDNSLSGRLPGVRKVKTGDHREQGFRSCSAEQGRFPNECKEISPGADTGL